MGRGAPVRRLSGAAAGARGSIPMPSEPPLAAETGHERPADMPNQHLRWNSVTRRPLAPPRPDWPVRRGLTSNPSATATRGRRPSSPRPTLRPISARIVIAITRLLRRPARCALPSHTRLAGLHPLRISPHARAAGSRDTSSRFTLQYSNTILDHQPRETGRTPDQPSGARGNAFLHLVLLCLSWRGAELVPGR